jgi:hypothetical protein
MKESILLKVFYLFSLSLSTFEVQSKNQNLQLDDLVTPIMTKSAPSPGKRVRQVASEYNGTQVYHSLYLPTDWQWGKSFPVLIEYTGNKFVASGATGEVKDANLGYGLSGGKGFIWVTMPYIQKDKKENALPGGGIERRRSIIAKSISRASVRTLEEIPITFLSAVFPAEPLPVVTLDLRMMRSHRFGKA